MKKEKLSQKEEKLSQVELRRVLCYNPCTGNFMWRIKPRPGIKIGSIAGCIQRPRSTGRTYRIIRLYGDLYSVHRLAFLYIKGYWPREVDHKDENGLNNRWSNLRECTHSQNVANQGPRKDNKLGVKGVYRRKSGKYRAQINIMGKRTHLGNFDTLVAATLAYRKAAKKYFGEFAK